MDSCDDTPKGWVAPFGHPRINACSRLPVAFRSVPRPSSPPGAKASTECPSLAQHPTNLSFIIAQNNERKTPAIRTLVRTTTRHAQKTTTPFLRRRSEDQERKKQNHVRPAQGRRQQVSHTDART